MLFVTKIFDTVKLNLYESRQCYQQFVRLNSSDRVMKVLNVAEKNDAAKNIAGYLSRGTCNRREGLSKYNKIYEFTSYLWNQNCEMIMTSVSGHLLNYEFTGAYRKWNGCHPLTLFDAPVVKHCPEQNFKIRKTLEKEVKKCNALIIWTDCDREGENIGFEIIEVCRAIKSNIRICRAKFSEITQVSINRALQNLCEPNKAISDAVNVRSELDLRIGAAFTRFQTMRLTQVFPRSLADMLISYGSCQFPTLGFVVERFLAVERFKPEPYWKLKVMDIRDDISVEFRWARGRLFEKLPCEVFLDICLEQPKATVLKVLSKPKSKWRPLPLDTVELEKQGSRKLHLSAKETMKTAEKLYTQGLISYPRTETNIFPKELNLVPLVSEQINNPAWGNFAQQLLEKGPNPRQGKKSDQAHPPIHPTKYTDSLNGNEAKVYEFVVRHFLACLSSDAVGQETTVEIDVAGEKFGANGLQIIEKNYLNVYIYEKWSNKEIHIYQEGQIFQPTSIDMVQEETCPPRLLTEADLISLMDKYGIGTDATHAEHIDTIKSRQYVGLTDGKYLIPGKLGIGLVMGYDSMGFEMSKPNLRANLEKDLQLICDRQKNPKDVLEAQIKNYRDVFKITLERANLIDKALADYLDERPSEIQEIQITQETVVFKCPKCGSDMTLKDRKQGTGKYIGCMNYPTCNNAIWFPLTVECVEISDQICSECPGNIRKLKFKFLRNAFPIYGTDYTTCIGGCDPMFNEALNIKDENIKSLTSVNDSGTFDGIIVPNSSSIRSSGTRPFSNTENKNLSGSNASIGFVRNQNNNRNREGSRNIQQQNISWNNTNTSPDNLRLSENEQSKIWGNIDDNAIIMCKCHENAIQLTVRKEGPNHGRLFYRCAKPQGSNCDFFLWASDSAQQMQNNVNRNSNSMLNASTSTGSSAHGNSYRGVSNNDVKCHCNQIAVRRIVQKDGPNKGRPFLTCNKSINESCKFFQWADEDDGNTYNMSGKRDTRAFKERGNEQQENLKKKRRVTTGKRKCGICGIEGHTRKTCPENAMD
ncbi:DNA topoisomerase 3-alpha [Frieseomelitta varia]|uniref:DNA topoisomerase 3-alpha n=1 Tax=Frieseomelitta varia TaxID=561572 RepID=UPI001CB6A682|nr:DNA topoisomerase 3-alpha [Frieseomelitta varia]